MIMNFGTSAAKNFIAVLENVEKFFSCQTHILFFIETRISSLISHFFIDVDQMA